MYTYKIWDKKSDLNGIEAKIYIREYNIADGECYYIEKDSHMLYFQAHNPFESGNVKMTKENISSIAEMHIEMLKRESEESKAEVNSIKSIAENQQILMLAIADLYERKE